MTPTPPPPPPPAAAAAAPPAAPPLRTLLLLLLCCAVSAAADDGLKKLGSLRSILDSVQNYEITDPLWLHLDTHNTEHPEERQVEFSAEGQQFRLNLEKNKQLLARGYQEIWYSAEGTRKSSSPSPAEHCFYHGTVEGFEDSSVAVSTCSGLRGLISLNTSVSYLIEPLPPSNVTRQHVVFRAESLWLPAGGCLHHHGNAEQQERLHDLIRGTMMSPRSRREKRDVSGSMKYVELLMVADKAEFEKHGSDLKKTKQKLLEAANLVDKYYKALNIRVALIGLEVWSDQDQIKVSDNPHSTLASFLTWRRKQLRVLPNDNAQLITGQSFQGTTIGLAPLKAMCSDYQSGGVNTDHSESAVGVAATMAHEMGHNFGMNHDSAGCCQARAEEGGCIMAAATGHPFPRVFNGCNEKELKSYLSSGGGKCLFNLPNTRVMYGGQRCGNGYLEEGEECDCGEEEECNSPCCNANNCTLKAGAECAHGICCNNCKLKSPGELCRAPSGPCDLPEYCDGRAESCPANFYLVDGTMCARGRAYCYTGMCLTLEQQCQSLWGSESVLEGTHGFSTYSVAQFGDVTLEISLREEYKSSVMPKETLCKALLQLEEEGARGEKHLEDQSQCLAVSTRPERVERVSVRLCGDGEGSPYPYGRPAPDLCFKKVNEAGDMYGNCGKDLFGKYRSCKDSDAVCGKIQCLTSAVKPIENNAVRIETTVNVGGRRVRCMGTHVYKRGDEETQGDTLDPGLVMTGTKCGEDSICFNGQCRNASFLQADECNAKCHGHGLCNNNHNCHCDPGWAPPLCEQRGSGGSVDSGPVICHNRILSALLVLPLLLFLVLAAVGLWCCYRHKLHPLKASPPPPLPSSEPVEGKPLCTDPHMNGHTNPTFLLKKQHPVLQGKPPLCPSPSTSLRSKQDVVRPVVKPPPVPAPVAQQNQKRPGPQHQAPERKTWTPPPPSGPPPSGPPPPPAQDPKSRPEAAKHRPNPPSRPPPPCPVSRPAVGKLTVKTATNAALAPSAGQKTPKQKVK